MGKTHDPECPCATDSTPHGARCADCCCEQAVKAICPTCNERVKFEIINGRCKACRFVLADEIVRAVSELPDRSSPEDWPEAMIVTDAELRRIVMEKLESREYEKDGDACGACGEVGSGCKCTMGT